IGSAAAAILFALGPDWPWAIACFAAVGVFNSSIVPANEVTNLRLDERNRAASFSILVGAIVGSQALGAAIGGIAARAWGVRQAVLAAMVLAWLVSTTALLRVPRGRHAWIRGLEATTPSD